MLAVAEGGKEDVSVAISRRQLLNAGALTFASVPLRAFAQDAEEEEEEEEDVVGGTAKNAFDSTERVLAPKGDDPLDS